MKDMKVTIIIAQSGYESVDIPSSEVVGSSQVENYRVLRVRMPDDGKWYLQRAKDASSIAGLHREFAKLSFSESDIVRFANKYGFLGGCEKPLLLKDKSDPRGIESFDHWYTQITYLKAAVRLWDAAILPSYKELDKLIFKDEYGATRYRLESHLRQEHALVRTDLLAEELRIKPASNAKVLPAILHVHYLVNEYLHRLCYPRLFISPEKHENELRFELCSNYLLGAIWMLFAEDIALRSSASGMRQRPCETCGKMIDYQRSTKRQCNACKQRSYRKRKPEKEKDGAVSA